MKLALLLAASSFYLHAATIAIIDSGVDVEHKDLVSKLWTNPVDVRDNNRDEDGNGYQDDYYGWNFAENNNLVIDRKYIGSFSDVPYTYFGIQKNILLDRAYPGQNNVTEDQKHWVRVRTDKNYEHFDEEKAKAFAKEMGIFGNFVHGTHVAGIAQEGNQNAKILSVKLLPTEVKPFAKQMAKLAKKKSAKADFRYRLLENGLKQLAKAQVNQLETVFHYVGQHKADIANGSFGTGFTQAKMIVTNLFPVVFFRKPKPADMPEIEKVAKGFLQELVTLGKSMVATAPNTLFVFAAGNDNSANFAANNDIYPASPASIRADNVITVAATYKDEVIAPFSNFGTKNVDIAAPGMLINSQIPGDEYLVVSGTSQAAPYITNVAAQVKDANPQLSPKQIKQILMGTVDKKNFLKVKVAAGGVVNTKRAVFAGRASKTASLREAIASANRSVKDAKDDDSFKKRRVNVPYVTPIPLLGMFK